MRLHGEGGREIIISILYIFHDFYDAFKCSVLTENWRKKIKISRIPTPFQTIEKNYQFFCFRTVLETKIDKLMGLECLLFSSLEVFLIPSSEVVHFYEEIIPHFLTFPKKKKKWC